MRQEISTSPGITVCLRFPTSPQAFRCAALSWSHAADGL